MKLTTLTGIAAIAYTAGYRAEHRDVLGLLLACTDDELDTICNLMTMWEEAGKK